jgi:hypothetical protein
LLLWVEAVRCGAVRAGAAARSLFGFTGGSSALADSKAISVESKQTPESNTLLMTRPRSCQKSVVEWYSNSNNHINFYLTIMTHYVVF